jgi:hypothetical protein
MFVGLVALAGAGCVHEDKSVASRGTVKATADVTISQGEDGKYAFRYSGPFADEKGNFDFSQEGAEGNTIELTFAIADGSLSGIRFRSDPRDAIWIVEKSKVDPKTGSPAGPYRGDQFFDFRVSEDGGKLMLTDRNDDGVLYRYGLRFDRGDALVFDDPDAQNGSRD